MKIMKPEKEIQNGFEDMTIKIIVMQIINLRGIGRNYLKKSTVGLWTAYLSYLLMKTKYFFYESRT